MSRAAVGYSERADAALAGRLAAAAASGPLGREEVRTLLLVAVGPHAAAPRAVAQGAREHCPHATVAVVGGNGAMVPEGEMQGIGAVVALALRAPSTAEVYGDAEALGARLREEASPGLLFGRRALTRGVLDVLAGAPQATALTGGAIDPACGLAAMTAGDLQEGDLLAARIGGGLRMVLGSTVAVRPIGAERTVTRVDRGYVTGLDGQRPLSLLGRAVAARDDRPLVLVRWSPEGAGAAVVRGIGGIDPKRGAIFVGPDVMPGDRLVYCVPDAQAGRDDLRACVQRLRAGTFGGVPIAAIVVESAGRGVRLHGKPHVDARALRRALGDVPFVGVRTTQEIVRVGDRFRTAGHTMVVGLLFAPS